MRDGHLFGSLIDILRNGAPTLIIAVGMTLVIATRGIDLSVGAVAAISGAVACSIILGSPEPGEPGDGGRGRRRSRSLISLVLGMWNGFLVAVLGIQPIIATLILMTAGRGVAMLITEGQILTVNSPPFKALGSGFWLGIPIAVIIAAVMFGVAALRHPAHGARHVHRVGRHQPRGEPPGRRAGAGAALRRLHVQRVLRGDRRAHPHGEHGRGRRQQHRACSSSSTRSSRSSSAARRSPAAGTRSSARSSARSSSRRSSTTVYTVGIPPIATMVFKAAVVTIVCLLQSPTTTEALAAFRRRLALRAGKGVAAS